MAKKVAYKTSGWKNNDEYLTFLQNDPSVLAIPEKPKGLHPQYDELFDCSLADIQDQDRNILRTVDGAKMDPKDVYEGLGIIPPGCTNSIYKFIHQMVALMYIPNNAYRRMVFDDKHTAYILRFLATQETDPVPYVLRQEHTFQFFAMYYRQELDPTGASAAGWDHDKKEWIPGLPGKFEHTTHLFTEDREKAIWEKHKGEL